MSVICHCILNEKFKLLLFNLFIIIIFFFSLLEHWNGMRHFVTEWCLIIQNKHCEFLSLTLQSLNIANIKMNVKLENLIRHSLKSTNAFMIHLNSRIWYCLSLYCIFIVFFYHKTSFYYKIIELNDYRVYMSFNMAKLFLELV